MVRLELESNWGVHPFRKLDYGIFSQADLPSVLGILILIMNLTGLLPVHRRDVQKSESDKVTAMQRRYSCSSGPDQELQRIFNRRREKMGRVPNSEGCSTEESGENKVEKEISSVTVQPRGRSATISYMSRDRPKIAPKPSHLINSGVSTQVFSVGEQMAVEKQATQSASTSDLLSDMDELKPYVLQNVQGLQVEGKDAQVLDSGAYGVVFQVTVNGLPCMAKRLHAILVKDISEENKSNIEERFRQECILLSRLQHPNIVGFIGVCNLESKTDLTLVMEKLHTDVASFVRRHPNVPIPIKMSIALDVSYGLLYLHNQTPPIIHRDLTAPNVLLTIDVRAKIADLGVSKVLNNPLLATKTAVPGNVHYMAPETKFENPKYDTSVDVFSFGHLLLHLAIQDWPPVFETGDHQALQQGLMEIAKRKRALEMMGEGNPFQPLALECLRDNPVNRPGVKQINKRLADLCTHQYPKSFADILDVTDEGEKSHLTGEHTAGQETQAGDPHKQDLQEQVKTLRQELTVTGNEKDDLTQRYSTLTGEHKQAEEQVTSLTAEKQALTKECESMKDKNHQLRLEMESNRAKLEETIADTSRLHDDVLGKKLEAQQFEKKAASLKAKLAERDELLKEREKALEKYQELTGTREEENETRIARLVEDNRKLDEERFGLAEDLDKVVFESREKIEKALNDFQHQFTALRLKHGAEQRADPQVEGDHPRKEMAPNLPGVEVIGHIALVVTRSTKSFKWDEHGLEIHVPPNSLPPEIDHCVLQIYASLAGQYKLPDDHQLVSAVYWVRPVPYCQFVEPLTLQIQHCAKKQFLKNLSFFRAVCTQENLPYEFTKVEGKGSFSEESSYGSLKLKHFSGFGIGAEGDVERMYSAGLYYLGRDVKSWEIHLVVTWDSEAHNREIRKHYERREALRGPVMTIEFEGNDLKLNIPMEGLIVGEWTIRPLMRPQLARRRVDYFKPGKTIPHCQLTAKVLQDEAAARELHYPMAIDGAREPNNMIVIEIDPRRQVARRPRYSLRGAPPPDDIVTLEQLMAQTRVTENNLTQRSTDETLSLIAPHVPDWKKCATALQLTDQDVQQIDTDRTLDVHMKAVSVLKRWRRRSGFRATYKRLVEVCLSIKEALLAEQVCRIILQQAQ